MKHEDKLLWLIKYLINESPKYNEFKIPTSEIELKNLFRSLMNVRHPVPIGNDFIKIQDEYLLEERKQHKNTSLCDLVPIEKNIYLWKGDITTLSIDAIVNAANSTLLGCFIPCHKCIDNAIHSSAGIQLRLECNKIMKKQGFEEAVGSAKITSAFNLPSQYILHTVGPLIDNQPTFNDVKKLESCYHSCLLLAKKHQLKSIAFCCISTGEFHYPNQEAAEIAVNTVRKFIRENSYEMEVVFNVFKEEDYQIYKQLFGKH